MFCSSVSILAHIQSLRYFVQNYNEQYLVNSMAEIGSCARTVPKIDSYRSLIRFLNNKPLIFM